MAPKATACRSTSPIRKATRSSLKARPTARARRRPLIAEHDGFAQVLRARKLAQDEVRHVGARDRRYPVQLETLAGAIARGERTAGQQHRVDDRPVERARA